MVHWLPAKLSAISSPRHRASINQYAPQAARPRWRGNNTARGHAYLNIQGLLVAADWAPRRCPARPRRWERKRRRSGSLKWGSWLACDSPTRSNWLHLAAGRTACVRVCVCFFHDECANVTSLFQEPKCVLIVIIIIRLNLIFKNIHLNLEI